MKHVEGCQYICGTFGRSHLLGFYGMICGGLGAHFICAPAERLYCTSSKKENIKTPDITVQLMAGVKFGSHQ